MKRFITSMFLLALVAVLSPGAVAATYYGFKVGGVSVNSDNCGNITGSNILSGTVSYDPATNTVTFSGVSINRTGSDNRALYNESNSGLIVRFEGINSLIARNAAPVRIERTTTFIVDGTTRIWGYDEGAIYIKGAYKLTIKGPGNLEVSATSKGGIEGSSDNNTVEFSDVTATIYGGGGDLLDLYGVSFSAGSHVTLKSVPGMPNVKNVDIINFNGMEVAQSPDNAVYRSSAKSLVYYNYATETYGSTVSGTDILISDRDVAVVNNATYFPDDNFRKHIIGLYPKNFISTREAAALQNLVVNSKQIGSLKGIEFLTGVTMLNCNTNNLTSLDLSKNTALKQLNVSYNQLTSLDLTQNTLLEDLMCHNNRITSLILPNNSELRSVVCNDNLLTSLNLSGNTKLQNLTCYRNRMTIAGTNTMVAQLPRLSSAATINFQMRSDDANIMLRSAVQTARGKNFFPKYSTGGTTWYAYEGVLPITSDYFPDNAFRTYLAGNADPNGDTYIDQYEISDITTLRLTNLGISDLTGINYFTDLTGLYCGNNSLTSLWLTKNTKLKILECNNNTLGSLNLSYLPELESLNCAQTGLETLEPSLCPDLTTLNCAGNGISRLNLSANTKLTRVIANGNRIAGEHYDYLFDKLPERTGSCYLDFFTTATGETNEQLSFKQAGLLKEKGWTARYQTAGSSAWREVADYVAINSNTFPDANFRNFMLEQSYGTDARLYWSEVKTITSLGAWQRQITSLAGVEYLTELESLYCQENQITELDLSQNLRISKVYCHLNNISAEALDRLIANLPAAEDGIIMFKNGDSDQNVMPTSAQARNAAGKNWTLRYWKGSTWVDVPTSSLLGDINLDGRVDITDLNLVVNAVLSNPGLSESGGNPDLNGDNRVDVTDLNMIISIILNN